MAPKHTDTENKHGEDETMADYTYNENSSVVESSDFSDQLDEMWKGLKKFWPRLLILVLLCTIAFYAYNRINYAPEYTASSTLPL